MEEDTKLKQLKRRIEDNREERARYQKMYDDLQDRTREIVDAKEGTPMSFWCETCEADFNARGSKITRKQPGKLPIAWWVAYCPAFHKCVRRITEKVNDPYYLRSYAVRRDRSRYKDDLLTPDQDRFWLLYGNKHGFQPWT